MKTGIFADHEILEFFSQGCIGAPSSLDYDQIQPASLDLRLGQKAWRVRASFIPGSSRSVLDKMEQLKLHEIDLTHGAVLETGCVYIVPLLEHLNLPEKISASTNPKSSTGRLDIFTRIMTHNAEEFDKIPTGYCGPLYIEISPRTFPIIVRTGSRLSQIRFRQGNAILSETELRDLHATHTVVAGKEPNITRGGVALSIDLQNKENGIVGYRAKRHTDLIDVDACGLKDISEFWEPVRTCKEGNVILDPDEFYILVSQESVHVPPLYAAEMTPFDPLVGEFRVHYAGFFDPGFGHEQAGGLGSRAVLEVRSYEVPFILEHGQIMGRLVYENMLSKPKKIYGKDIDSHYQAQGLRLSKHFCM